MLTCSLFLPTFSTSRRYGQPPADIIKELAPGLEFDEEGMPKMDGQMPGMPFPPGVGGDEQCTVEVGKMSASIMQ